LTLTDFTDIIEHRSVNWDKKGHDVEIAPRPLMT